MRLALHLHPASRCDAANRIAVEVTRTADLCLRYIVEGDIAAIRVPSPTKSARTDGLWQHTCFEAFVAEGEGAAYAEYNFAPSTHWAAYAFTAPRTGMAPLETVPPRIETVIAPGHFELTATIALDTAAPLRLALSAVIEETNGNKSWWALAHPAAKPDFHHPDSFVCRL
ncbi:MAG: DOMON-like domain-containing protein [Pseudomonadota bacterium]|nr:DOMON-like domain-containing protein [Pseudomonadota bacterium]